MWGKKPTDWKRSTKHKSPPIKMITRRKCQWDKNSLKPVSLNKY